MESSSKKKLLKLKNYQFIDVYHTVEKQLSD